MGSPSFFYWGREKICSDCCPLGRHAFLVQKGAAQFIWELRPQDDKGTPLAYEKVRMSLGVFQGITEAGRATMPRALGGKSSWLAGPGL